MVDPRIELIAQLTRIIVPPIMVTGIVGNLFNIAVLTRPGLYNHPCSRYFLVLACNNLFFSIFLLTFRLLSDGYQLDPTKTCLFCCKTILYIQQVSMFVSAYLIVLASIDRFCGSSSNIKRRNFSTLIVTRWAIIFVFSFFILFFISSLVMLDTQPGQAVPCRISVTTIYSRIYPLIQAVLFTIIPPLLMTIFGLLTIYNTKQIQVLPVLVSRFRRTEHQLIRMLLVQVGSHLVLSIPLCIIYIIGFIPVTLFNAIEYYFLFRITQLFFGLSYATSVVIYFLSSGVYRKELIRIIKKPFEFKRNTTIRPICNQQILPTIPTKTVRSWRIIT